MSQLKTYPIACPKCNHPQEVDLYDAINTVEDPDLRNELIGNKLIVVTCEECSFVFSVDKPLLYHDPELDIMIYWMPLHDQTIEEGEQQFREFITTLAHALPDDIPAPQVHLVFTRSELAERLFILEAELDERIIEYMKYMIYARNIEKVHPAKKYVLFNSHDSTEDQLAFIIQDIETRKIEGLLHYDRAAYDSLDEMFDDDEQTPDLFEFFPGPYISARELMLNELNREP
ncbi:MAG: CpXC domain-containing protein [Kiritimatiellae bacterium]|nr:CpXC domain-containing protein [Kiritimatiellia bacterium]